VVGDFSNEEIEGKVKVFLMISWKKKRNEIGDENLT